MNKKTRKPCAVCQDTKSVDLKGKSVERGMGLECPKCVPAAHRRFKYGRLWLVVVYGDVDPEVHGPYNTVDMQDRAALRFRKEDTNQRNGIFALQVNKRGYPVISAYSGGFMELALQEKYGAKKE